MIWAHETITIICGFADGMYLLMDAKLQRWGELRRQTVETGASAALVFVVTAPTTPRPGHEQSVACAEAEKSKPIKFIPFLSAETIDASEQTKR